MSASSTFTWWPPKKKRSIPGFPWVLYCTFANFFRSCSKIFSPPKIKDNSKFNKEQGQEVEIKDCPLK